MTIGVPQDVRSWGCRKGSASAAHGVKLVAGIYAHTVRTHGMSYRLAITPSRDRDRETMHTVPVEPRTAESTAQLFANGG